MWRRRPVRRTAAAGRGATMQTRCQSRGIRRRALESPPMSAAAAPQERVQNDLKQAMKARDAERTSTLRMLLAELKNERIKVGHEVGEEEFVAVVQRGVKQRNDSVEQYRQNAREELAAKEEREVKVLTTYLPAQV